MTAELSIIAELNAQGVQIDESETDLLYPMGLNIYSTPHGMFSQHNREQDDFSGADLEGLGDIGGVCDATETQLDEYVREVLEKICREINNDEVFTEGNVVNSGEMGVGARCEETTRRESLQQEGCRDATTNNRITRRRTRASMTTYNENELAERIIPSQTDAPHTYSMPKSCPIGEGLLNFTSEREKPKGKSSKLSHEAPSYGVFKNKCGFSTHRPLVWAKTLEDIINGGGELAHYQWDYLCDGNDVILEIRIRKSHDSSLKKTTSQTTRTTTKTSIKTRTSQMTSTWSNIHNILMTHWATGSMKNMNLR